MEAIFIVVGLMFVVALCLAATDSPNSFFVSMFAVFISVFVAFLVFNGRTAPLQINTEYTVKAEYYSSADVAADRILLLNSGGIDAYTYQVNCAEIKGGCPTSFPPKFTVVKDGKQLVIIPLESDSK